MIQWGKTSAYGSEYSKADSGVGEYETFHTVSLLGLEPSTTYHFRVGFRDYDANPTERAKAVTWSGDFTFTTTQEDPAPRRLFVSTGGDDDNDGLTPGTPWKTLARAAREARAGDVVTIAPGRYVELLRPLQTGTSAENRVTFRAEKPLTVFLEGGNTKSFEGRSHCVQIMNKAFLTLENLSFARTYVYDNGGYRGGMGYGSLVLLSGAPGTEVKNCVMDGRGGYAVGILALGQNRLPGVSAEIPEVVVEDSLFLRTWWAAYVFSETPRNSAVFRNNAFVRSLILKFSGNAPDHSMVMRNNIYQSLIPTKNRNRLFAKPALLDSDYNCFTWDAANELRHVAYLDEQARTFVSGLAGWQEQYRQDLHGIEAYPGYPLSTLAGFVNTEKQDANRPLVIEDLILPSNSPCRGVGENGVDIGPRWEKFLKKDPGAP
jgi:hypothetical protein